MTHTKGLLIDATTGRELARIDKKIEVTLLALPAMLILSDLNIQGNIKPVRSLSEPLRAGMDNGARRTLIPTPDKRNFMDVSADIVERVDPIFYSDPLTAAMKALGMN